MVKVVRVGSKGTSRRVVEKEPDNWAGDSYKKFQNQVKESMKNKNISTGKGTSKTKYGDIADTSGTPSGKGRYVTTGRGTGRKKIA